MAHVQLALPTGEPWHRFVEGGRVLGSGPTALEAFEDAQADRRRRSVARAFVQSIIRKPVG